MHQIIPSNEVLFIGSYPPRACGIATYGKDLMNAIRQQFSGSFSPRICALEKGDADRDYPDEVKYVLRTADLNAYSEMAETINKDVSVRMVFVQHEFGLYGGDYGGYLLQLLCLLKKPVIVTFHTVLPDPNAQRKIVVRTICAICDEVVVMTERSSDILQNDYAIKKQSITVIPHGTHTFLWRNKELAKREYQLENRMVLSTFGLLSSNKSIETALDALPEIVARYPNVLYLILGKTHPGVVEHEGEKYRKFLEGKTRKLGLENNVRFVNKYLHLEELLEYLYLTDIYLFTSKDPNQAVSGTFVYAMSAACPVISTPIPHALEMLHDNAGVIVDFQNSKQLATATIQLIEDDELRENMGRNAFHQTRATVWENAAVAHAQLFSKYLPGALSQKNSDVSLNYNWPPVKLDHFYRLTDGIGMIQFSAISEPDIDSGYTLDDNARAMIAMCMHYEKNGNAKDIALIETYLDFIKRCQQPNGRFLNYVDKEGEFHVQNDYTNLEDSNGRALWALGVLMSHKTILPRTLVATATAIFHKAMPEIIEIESPRAMAFSIKGLFFYNQFMGDIVSQNVLEVLATRLLEKYNAVADTNWQWFEEYLTYANSTLPEAMLYAYRATKQPAYRMIAHLSFEFLLSHLFVNGTIKVVSNRGWHQKGELPHTFGEQPIDVSYTIQALELFYEEFGDEGYRKKQEIAFSWFLGNNHLHQIIYNPLSGGCYDGLEENNVNLNQGAESTVCYLIARLTVEKMRTALLPKVMHQLGVEDKLQEGPVSRLLYRRVAKTRRPTIIMSQISK